MKTHSPFLILAFWLTAMIVTCCMLYSCERTDVRPGRDCPHTDRDTSVTLPEMVSQSS